MGRLVRLTDRDLALYGELELFAYQQGGAFSSAQARALGAEDGQQRRLTAAKRLRRERRGVYSVTAYRPEVPDPDHLRECASVLAALRGDNVISHVSALRLLGLPTPLAPDLRVHITRRAPRYGNAPQGTVVHVAEFDNSDLTEVHGLPVLTGGRLVIDCYSTLSRPDVLAVADGTVRAGHATIDDLRRTARLRIQTPRTAGFIEFIDLVDPLAENWLESVSRWWLLDAGLPRPRLQVPIEDPRTGRRIRLDMLFDDHGTVGEVDGRAKYLSTAHLLAEKAREDWLRSEHQFEVVRWGLDALRSERSRARWVRGVLGAFDRFTSRTGDRSR